MEETATKYMIPTVYFPMDEGGNGTEAGVFAARHLRLRHVRAIRTIHKDIDLRGINIATHSNINQKDIDFSRIDDDLQKEIDEKLKDNHTYQRFKGECQKLLLLGNGAHPYIENIYQYGMFQCSPSMPHMYTLYTERNYIPGDNLNKYLEKNNYYVPLKEVFLMAEHISSALAYCHEDIWKYCKDKVVDKLQTDPLDGTKQIISDEKRKELINKYQVIHNDIHSCNIMRHENGFYVLIDFGHSFNGNEQEGLTPGVEGRKRGGAIITRAPELYDDNPNERSDIYSFGVVLYQYYTGSLPFSCNIEKLNNGVPEEERSLRNQKKNFKFSSNDFEGLRKAHCVSEYDEIYPQWLEEVITKCMNSDPNKRYRNGKELHNDIKGKIEEYKKQQQRENRNRCIAEINRPEELQIEVAQLKKENRELSEQNTALQDTNKALNRRLDTVNSQLNQLQIEVAQLKKENRELSEQNTALQDTNRALNSRLNSAQNQLNQLQLEVAQLKKENRELSEQNTALQDTNRVLNRRLDSAQNQLIQLQLEVAQLKKENKKLEEKISTAQKKLLVQQARILDLSRESEELKQENRKLNNELEKLEEFRDKKNKWEWTIFWFVFWIIGAVAVAVIGFMYLYRVYIKPCKDIGADYHKHLIEVVDSLNSQISQKDQQIQQRDSMIKKQKEDIKIIIDGFNKR